MVQILFDDVTQHAVYCLLTVIGYMSESDPNETPATLDISTVGDKKPDNSDTSYADLTLISHPDTRHMDSYHGNMDILNVIVMAT